jgi:methylmalonyl-CoA mutase
MSEPEQPLALTADFPAATHEAWRKLVDRVLKGAPFERLESTTYDDLRIEPLYERAASATVISGRPPGAAWTVMQRIDHPDPAAANAQALDDLENGATGLMLVFADARSANDFGLDPSPAALARVLDGVHLDAGVVVELDLSRRSHQVVSALVDLIASRGLAPSSVQLRAGLDPIGADRSVRTWEEVAPEFTAFVAKIAGAGVSGPLIVADGRVVHDAGGSEAQELAFTLSCAVAYLRALEAAGIALKAARDLIYFKLAADMDQFLTTAKFRAVRQLWARVENACGLVPKPATVTADTAWRMMTRRDPYTNMLRAAIAVAAAGFGGADSIAVMPHTAPLGLPDAFARRIARNTQLLLLEESNLARVADPAAGSGAIEALTRELCGAAWALFQEIERSGGAGAPLAHGLIQEKVGAVRSKREDAVARRKELLTGTNEFAEIFEATPSVLTVAAPHDFQDASVMARTRLAERFEALRDASDYMLAKTGARPKIFLANLGTQAEFAIRATFAKNFFEAGGIEAVTNDGFASLDEMVAALKASGAGLACLCSSDEVYAREAAAAARALAPHVKHLYLAGRPSALEPTLRSAGVQSFVYAGCDAVSLLQAAYRLLSNH